MVLLRLLFLLLGMDQQSLLAIYRAQPSLAELDVYAGFYVDYSKSYDLPSDLFS